MIQDAGARPLVPYPKQNYRRLLMFFCRPIVSFLSLVAGLVLLSGCGGGLASSVTGTVTLDGKPVNKGNVTFYPVKDGPATYGVIGADGSYSLSTGANSGVVPGDYTVVIVITGDPPPEQPGKPPLPPEVLSPKKYGTKETSDLKVTVKPGSNVIPLNMVK